MGVLVGLVVMIVVVVLVALVLWGGYGPFGKYLGGDGDMTWAPLGNEVDPDREFKKPPNENELL